MSTNKQIETNIWRYSIFDNRHSGIVIAKNKRETKSKIFEYYFEKASQILNTARPALKNCGLELWNITEDGYFGDGVCETY